MFEMLMIKSFSLSTSFCLAIIEIAQPEVEPVETCHAHISTSHGLKLFNGQVDTLAPPIFA